ncbi:putative NADH-ubiquinone oxidoreductase 299 kDa subunit [Elsinoe ampelina]|uniref:Putative NADH-ubiquinone oxidoreductase 299 kDa subunit n=1 Tax=Elsinoe ampelina TaxID=302913 RepID=A0A6A6G1M1_9PEZI|nr:putative NADH-ubiquinone oxidoreductase 299 kDa subunit [Elsinoe ampelina]
MRATGILRAVARSGQFLEAGAPTGLTGLLTHASPRSSLIYIYSNTLDKLKQLPESSVYRQSTEALTKHRLNIIESTKPAGLSEWQERVRKTIEAHPQAFQSVASQANPSEVNFVPRYTRASPAKVAQEQKEEAPEYSPEDMSKFISQALEESKISRGEVEGVEAEPALTAEQINELESKIGAGLIEEVIQVAEGESQLVDTMIQSRVYEELEEKPVEGQWTYHERDRHTPTTQAPPSS